MSQYSTWTTELVEDTIVKLRSNSHPDLSCFFEGDVELKNGNITFRLTQEELQEFDKCSQDIVYFVEKYCRFLTDKGRTPVKLRPYQKKILKLLAEEEYIEVLDDYGPKNRNLIMMQSRQTGKTTTTCAFFAWYLTFKTDRNLAILTNKDRTTIEVVSKVTDVFKGLPFFMKPGVLGINSHGMNLDNGNQMFSQATTKSASIGFTIHVLYADEFAHIEKGIVDAFWRSVYPTLSSSVVSQCIISSTPNGMDNKFYDLWDKSNTGENSFIPVRVDYWEVPGHGAEWATAFKKDFGEMEFAQEFELQFTVNSKLLLTAGQLQFIKRLEKDFVFKELHKTSLDDEIYRNLTWHPDFDPDRDFDPRFDRFAVTIDTGEGKEDDETQDNDYNVINIYKIEPKSIASIKKLRSDERKLKNMFRFRQVGLYRDNFKDAEDAAKVAKMLVFDQIGEDMCKVLVEMNFDGKSFIKNFSNHDRFYEDILLFTYHRKPAIGEKTSKKPGFKVGIDKEFYCKLGKRLIGERIIVPSDAVTIKEFSAFGKDKKGKYKGLASHDDTVMCTLNLSRLWDDDSYNDLLYDFLDDYGNLQLKNVINTLLENGTEDNDIGDNLYKSLYEDDEVVGGYSDELQKMMKTADDLAKMNQYTPKFSNLK